MSVTFFKRFRMEVDLNGASRPAPLPRAFWWVPWDESLVDHHAEVKFRCFCEEMDSLVFPCLGNLAGCQRLMREIRRKPGFLPGATWLIGCPEGYVATIQGTFEQSSVGMIQNVGVVPECRGLGLGRALVCKCLEGFRRAGAQRVFLEVTAENERAVRMYRSIGFRRAKTLYKVVNG